MNFRIVAMVWGLGAALITVGCRPVDGFRYEEDSSSVLRTDQDARSSSEAALMDKNHGQGARASIQSLVDHASLSNRNTFDPVTLSAIGACKASALIGTIFNLAIVAFERWSFQMAIVGHPTDSWGAALGWHEAGPAAQMRTYLKEIDIRYQVLTVEALKSCEKSRARLFDSGDPQHPCCAATWWNPKAQSNQSCCSGPSLASSITESLARKALWSDDEASTDNDLAVLKARDCLANTKGECGAKLKQLDEEHFGEFVCSDAITFLRKAKEAVTERSTFLHHQQEFSKALDNIIEGFNMTTMLDDVKLRLIPHFLKASITRYARFGVSQYTPQRRCEKGSAESVLTRAFPSHKGPKEKEDDGPHFGLGEAIGAFGTYSDTHTVVEDLGSLIVQHSTLPLMEFGVARFAGEICGFAADELRKPLVEQIAVNESLKELKGELEKHWEKPYKACQKLKEDEGLGLLKVKCTSQSGKDCKIWSKDDQAFTPSWASLAVSQPEAPTRRGRIIDLFSSPFRFGTKSDKQTSQDHVFSTALQAAPMTEWEPLMFSDTCVELQPSQAQAQASGQQSVWVACEDIVAQTSWRSIVQGAVSTVSQEVQGEGTTSQQSWKSFCCSTDCSECSQSWGMCGLKVALDVWGDTEAEAIQQCKSSWQQICCTTECNTCEIKTGFGCNVGYSQIGDVSLRLDRAQAHCLESMIRLQINSE